MKKILLFRHNEWIEAPYLTNLLQKIGIPYEFINIDEGHTVPKNIAESIGGLVFLGGIMGVNDPLPWIKDELDLIQLAYNNKFPVLGHCLGSQLISKALGGKVSPMENNEIGWYPITFLDNKVASDWKGKIPVNTKIMLWHHDEFTIPQGASPLYTTLNCKNQAFAIDNILATVAHIEVSASMLQNWLKIYGDDIQPNGKSIQSIEQIQNDLENKMLEMHTLSDSFYIKWLKLIFSENNHPEIRYQLESYLQTGSCLCKGITFFLKNPREIVNCHCIACRKFHGNYAAFTRVKLSNIHILGKEKISWYQVEKKQAQRGFCKDCGSSLFWCRENDDGICVAASTLNTPTKLKTTKNIYVDFKSDFYVLDNNLEKYSNTMKKTAYK